MPPVPSPPRSHQAQLDIEDFVSWDIDHLKVDGCQQFDELHMNGSYAIVGGMLREAAAKAGRPPVVYHPSNLGFKFPRQFRELASIGNQWRFFDDAQVPSPPTNRHARRLAAFIF